MKMTTTKTDRPFRPFLGYLTGRPKKEVVEKIDEKTEDKGRARVALRRYMRLRLPFSLTARDGSAQQLFLLSFFMHHERGRRQSSGTLRRWVRSFTKAFRDGMVGVFCPCWGWQFDVDASEDEVEEIQQDEEASEARRALVASLFRGRHDRRTYQS
jgi:hypothetical protein